MSPEKAEAWLEEFEKLQKEHLAFFKRCAETPPEKIPLEELYARLYERRKLQARFKEALKILSPEKISPLLPRLEKLRERERQIKDLVEKIRSGFLPRMRKDPASELKRKALRDYLRYA